MKKFREESNQLYSSKTKVVRDLERISNDLPRINSDMQYVKDKIIQMDENDIQNKDYLNKLSLCLGNKLDHTYK